MRVETYALRKGDVVDWDGTAYAVLDTEQEHSWRKPDEWVLTLTEVGVGGARSTRITHTVIAHMDETWQTVRIRGARYTQQQYMQLLEGEYNGRPY
jgi:hypothetical protein